MISSTVKPLVDGTPLDAAFPKRFKQLLMTASPSHGVFDERTLGSDKRVTIHCGVSIAPYSDDADGRTEDPVSVVFVADVSGSMKGGKADAMREALLHLHGYLGFANATLDVVTFSDEARLVIPNAEKMGKEEFAQKSKIVLDVGGSTNIGAAIKTAHGVLRNRRAVATVAAAAAAAAPPTSSADAPKGCAKARFCIFLFSDGDITAGPSEDQVLLDIMSHYDTNPVIPFGIGTDYAAFMKDIGRECATRFFYVDVNNFAIATPYTLAALQSMRREAARKALVSVESSDPSVLRIESVGDADAPRQLTVPGVLWDEPTMFLVTCSAPPTVTHEQLRSVRITCSAELNFTGCEPRVLAQGTFIAVAANKSREEAAVAASENFDVSALVQLQKDRVQRRLAAEAMRAGDNDSAMQSVSRIADDWASMSQRAPASATARAMAAVTQYHAGSRGEHLQHLMSAANESYSSALAPMTMVETESAAMHVRVAGTPKEPAALGVIPSAFPIVTVGGGGGGDLSQPIDLSQPPEKRAKTDK